MLEVMRGGNFGEMVLTESGRRGLRSACVLMWELVRACVHFVKTHCALLMTCAPSCVCAASVQSFTKTLRGIMD